MTIGYDPGTAPEQLSKPTWPGFPTTSTEFITLIAHYYRAEIARMAGWRDRIDRTSNWAITVVGAMLSISLSTPTAHHGVILFAMVLVLLLLVIEFAPLPVLRCLPRSGTSARTKLLCGSFFAHKRIGRKLDAHIER